MNRCFSQSNFWPITIGALVLLTNFTGATAVQALDAPHKALADLVTNGDKGSEIQLEVRQMPLAKVLESVAKQTKVPIHYSVLPEGVITATCVGTTLKPVLECLLNRKADLIVRYPKNSDKVEHKDQILEAWVLGSKLETPTNSSLCTATSESGSMSLNRKDFDRENDVDQSNEILKLTKSKNAAERADAIGALLAIGRDGDPTIKAALEEALHDSDASVRAQAVSTLTHRSDTKDESAAVIQEAMQDESVDVRMMAVDGITDDVVMLQQAVNDSDEVIRGLAQAKLDALTANASGKAKQ
jgi:HEAT repeat protein